ncbi:hypothetical protein [Agrococcus sp. SGAir0287]|uniref:hypothetical protein n=1 Tax=Agrococcus sp. SGAir0287 TaxID=2070347 RepID=UPI0010CCC3AF|nr:hypothetical protein [Agrococcus sp. SGAir0287]QCR18967.1 hypothetical protein C1N71_05485 [Agrococcus sp. SGAir0287]
MGASIGALAAAAASVALLVLVACAPVQPQVGDAAPSSDPSAPPSIAADVLPAQAVPSGEVGVRGEVVDVDGAPELCLGPQFSIAPPFACGGAPIVGLDWGEVDGEDAVGDTRWATMDLRGVFDGSTLTLTAEPTLADLSASPSGPPPSSSWEPPSDALLDVEAAVVEELGPRALSTIAIGDVVLLAVLYDDGSLQAYLDARHGEGVVEVTSLMTDVAG